MLYTGKEEEADEEDGPDSAEPYLKHYVGVYNPETGALDVMEARSMVVRGIVRAHQPRPEDLIAMVHSPYSLFQVKYVNCENRTIANKRMHLDKHSEPRKQRKQFSPSQRTPSHLQKQIEKHLAVALLNSIQPQQLCSQTWHQLHPQWPPKKN